MEFKSSRLKNFKTSISASDKHDLYISTLSRDEALSLLRDLSSENEDLQLRAQALNDQLSQILEEVENLQKTKELLERENTRLKSNYSPVK